MAAARGHAGDASQGATLYGAKDLFITKYNSSGTRLWTVEDGAVSGTTVGRGIATDTAGDVYVTGNASQPIDGQSQNGTFLSKYSSSGSLAWTSTNGMYSPCANGGVAVGESGNIHIVGCYRGQYGTTHIQEIYLAQYSDNGAQQWSYHQNAGYITAGASIAWIRLKIFISRVRPSCIRPAAEIQRIYISINIIQVGRSNGR